jgi:hypothetical protein
MKVKFFLREFVLNLEMEEKINLVHRFVIFKGFKRKASTQKEASTLHLYLR